MRLSFNHIEQVNSHKALYKCMLFSFKAKLFFYKLDLVFIVVTIYLSTIPFSPDFTQQVKGGALRTQ